MLKFALAQPSGWRPIELHRYITNRSKPYMLSYYEALMAIRKVMPVRIKDTAITPGFPGNEEFDSSAVPARTAGPKIPDNETPGKTEET